MRATASVDAPAKVNLLLRILHRRPDGFHELETLFQAISLSDRVRVTVGGEVDGLDGIGLVVDGPDLGPIQENLAYRAAAAFRERFDLDEEVDIALAKNIPAGAGLGGGSSDAAAVLKCLAALTGHDDHKILHAIAADLGSDVSFFLGASPLALGRGRGELLEDLPSMPQVPLVLALPPVHVSTAAAYSELADARAGGDDSPPATPRENIAVGNWDDIVSLAHNDFEAVIAPRHEEIAASLAGLRERGARVALLSGSGAACFGIFDDADQARGAAAWLEGRLGFPFVSVRTSRTMPLPRVEGG